MVEFKIDRYGADVATILEEPEQIVEIVRRRDGLFDLTIHNRNEEADTWNDQTATLKPRHFAALGSVVNHTLCREVGCPYHGKPPARSCRCHPSNEDR